MVKMNYKLMKQICLADISQFESLGDVYDTTDGIYIYRHSPNAKILAIAHLDTVLDTSHFHHIKVEGDSIVINAQLDDRLGVYTMLDILPQLGIEFDLLLTEGEETGRSTAAYFEPIKANQYNWMFSFDRHGDDVVLYQYDNKALRDDLKQAKFRIGMGSFSDIAFMSHLGICGLNIGTGYEGEHSTMSYANISTLLKQVSRFKAFYDEFQDKKYPYVPVKSKYASFSQWDRSTQPIYDGLYCYLCDKHQGKHQIINDVWLCDACFNDAGQCMVCQDVVYADELMDNICQTCQEY